ncbi:MAG: VWA domain-containing protein [Anaerolineae bacterium]|jgi:Ca-activated chloride channel family protein|nr:VWA domain-containing protein [Anaerolineae bacterium]
MKFLWPFALLALALIPLLILLYLTVQRRRRRYAVRYSSLSLLRAAIPAQSKVRRYLPMALFLVALASLAVALARPVTVTRVPAGRATVMLALDVSGSMRQNDIPPSRLVAAKQAALEFIDKQKNTNQVGIVAFTGIAQLVQTPTTDSDALAKAVRNLTTGRGTAIGDGIVTALETIDDFAQATVAAPTPGAPAAGDYRPDIIVLLTDGVATTGVDPLEAAQRAAEGRVRVYTIGFGTEQGGQFEGGGGPGQGMGGMSRDTGGFGPRRWGIDEESLKAIASMTGGEYYTATSARELQKVLDSLPTVLISREETLEITVAFALVAALLVAAAVLLSQFWHPLP